MIRFEDLADEILDDYAKKRTTEEIHLTLHDIDLLEKRVKAGESVDPQFLSWNRIIARAYRDELTRRSS